LSLISYLYFTANKSSQCIDTEMYLLPSVRQAAHSGLCFITSPSMTFS